MNTHHEPKELLRLPIGEVVVGPRLRPVGEVYALAESIHACGLLNPITVTPDRRLIAGAHRLEACKQLGWEYIAAHVLDADALTAELAEIDENLIRAELTVLERSEHLGRRKVIYEELHPETRSVNERGGPGRGKTNEIISPVSSFADDAAQKTGVSTRTVQQETKIAKDIAAPVKDSIRGTALADSKTDLIALSRLDEQEQEQAVALVTSGRAKTIKGAKLEMDKDRRDEAAQAEAVRPAVTLASWADWLPEQAPCDLLLTDPPYATDVGDIHAFAHDWLPAALAKVKPTGRAYVCVGAYPAELAAYLSAPTAHMTLKQVLVWTYRNTLGPSPTHDYKQNWQAILYFTGPDAPPLDCPVMVEQFSVQDINAPDGRQGNRYHAWQKPDELAERLIRHSTRPGDVVLDPFTCTGTFLLAAHRLGRVGRGCDISADNLAIAEQRGCQREG